jgi:hypothetical protein
MFLLRLSQFAEGEGRYRVVAEFENGRVRRSDESRFELQLSAQDQEDIRWYLEDFLQYPMDPAPAIAKRIEARMAEIGADLFTKALGNTEVWPEVRHQLSDTRIEIETTVKDATALPWELLRDPKADVPLALRARAFVRSTHDSVQRPKLKQSAAGPIRVLLVICRPRGRDDVPFRSVARRMLEGLRGSDAVRLTVLRPPTFEQLARMLREAQAAGEPYHLVHFDGHGVWSEDGPRKGGHGYLLFENRALDDNRQLVDGPALGNLLAETGVAALVLNACQSAYATPPSQPVTAAPDNPHSETRAFGSLAQEIMDAARREWWPCATASTSSPPRSLWRSCTDASRRATRWARPRASHASSCTLSHCARSPSIRGRSRTGWCRWSLRRSRWRCFRSVRARAVSR